MIKIFPIDVESLEKLGGYKFLKKKNNWPTKDRVFHNIIIKFFNSIINETISFDNIKKKNILCRLWFFFSYQSNSTYSFNKKNS